MNPGLSPAVQQALGRRGLGAAGDQGALTQVSSQAPMQSPLPQPNTPSDVPQGSAPQVSAAQKWQPQTQSDFIVGALAEQLKNSQKMETEKMKLSQGSGIPQPSAGVLPAAQTASGGGSPMKDYFSLSPAPLAKMNQQGGYPL